MTEEPTTQLNAVQAWSLVMRDVQAIAKGDTTEAAGRYKYRGVDTVMNEVGPALREHGVVFVPVKVESKHRDFTTGNNKLTHEAILTVTWRVYGPDGSFFEMESVGESADSADKATSQAHSVALRTVLLQGLCIPTGDPDPDRNPIDRNAPAAQSSPQDAEAQAQGWPNAADRNAAWLAGVERMGKLADTTELVAWGKKVGLVEETLTVDLAMAWKAKLDAAAESMVADAFEGAEQVTEDEHLPAAPAFDPASAWETLYGQLGKIIGTPGGDRIQKWIEAEGINDSTITQEQARELWNRIDSVTPAADQPAQPTLPATDQLTVADSGFKSRAEQTKTFNSLTARVDTLDKGAAAPDPSGKEALDQFMAENISTAGMLTKATATDWMTLVGEAELLAEEPF